MSVTIIDGDITVATVDVIVNAANPVMLGGGGVDGAIHRAAGPALLEACRLVPEINGVRCPTGEARITTAGNLNAEYVIHTVGPRYGIDPNHHTLLASAYRNTLTLAVENGCNTVALPAVSCGVYGYPLTEAAEIAISVCLEAEFASIEKTFYLFGEETFAIFSNALEAQSAS